MIIKIILIFISIIVLYGLIILLGSFNLNTDNADYVIVLGHQLKNNQYDDVLKYRLIKTLDYLNNNESKCILSGGITSNNTISEALVMKEYLITKGINQNRIIVEDKSKDTIENIKNCINLIKPNSKVVLISSNYHIVRSRMICRLFGIRVKGIGTYTPIIDLLKHIPIEEAFIFIHYFRIKNKQDA